MQHGFTAVAETRGFDCNTGKRTADFIHYESRQRLLVDVLGNVEGSQDAFQAVAPLMEGKDPELVKEIEEDFKAVYTALEPYETNKWPGFVLYTELTKADTRKLANVINALAEKLSLVPAKIVQTENT